jgi:hypothetical protein
MNDSIIIRRFIFKISVFLTLCYIKVFFQINFASLRRVLKKIY